MKLAKANPEEAARELKLGLSLIASADKQGYEHAYALRTLGEFYRPIDLKEAEKYYQQAQQLHEQLEDWKHFGIVLSELGTIDVQSGQNNVGFKKLTEAVEFLKQFAPAELPEAYRNLSIAHTLAGNVEKGRYFGWRSEGYSEEEISKLRRGIAPAKTPAGAVVTDRVNQTAQQPTAVLADSIRQLQQDQQRRQAKKVELSRTLSTLGETAEGANKSLLIEKLNADLEKEIMEGQREIERLQFAVEQQQLERERERNLGLTVGSALAIVLLTSVLFLLSKTRDNRKLAKLNSEITEQQQALAQQKEQLEIAQQKSEVLLLNILPASVTAELKEKGSATPRLYKEATVLFTDFQKFTHIARNMPPEQLLEGLNSCFGAFDQITAKLGVEKIKTIGDAYMCVSGVPVPRTDHAERAAAAATEMLAYFRQWKLEQQQKQTPFGHPDFQIRIGLHSGPVVAGVVGQRKFAYDIWGDTVNIASRMESLSAPDTITCSADTAKLLPSHFPLRELGSFSVKNRGSINTFVIKS